MGLEFYWPNAPATAAATTTTCKHKKKKKKQRKKKAGLPSLGYWVCSSIHLIKKSYIHYSY